VDGARGGRVADSGCHKDMMLCTQRAWRVDGSPLLRGAGRRGGLLYPIVSDPGLPGRGEHGSARWLAAGVVLRLRRWMMSSLAWRAAVDRNKFNM
jgi:hypothetical protein